MVLPSNGPYSVSCDYLDFKSKLFKFFIIPNIYRSPVSLEWPITEKQRVSVGINVNYEYKTYSRRVRELHVQLGPFVYAQNVNIVLETNKVVSFRFIASTHTWYTSTKIGNIAI